VGKEGGAERFSGIGLLRIASAVMRAQRWLPDLLLTLGIAYTKEPRGAEDADSVAAVVSKSSRFGPLFVNWRCMFVCGAFGRGNETSIGACDALLFMVAAAIVACLRADARREADDDGRWQVGQHREPHLGHCSE
jgi:hypothetical protein